MQRIVIKASSNTFHECLCFIVYSMKRYRITISVKYHEESLKLLAPAYQFNKRCFFWKLVFPSHALTNAQYIRNKGKFPCKHSRLLKQSASRSLTRALEIPDVNAFRKYGSSRREQDAAGAVSRSFFPTGRYLEKRY